MSAADRQLADDRIVRDAAREVFKERLDLIRGAIDRRSIPERAKDEALQVARSAAQESADVARESGWIVAATVAAVLIWILRAPLLEQAGRLVRTVREQREPATLWSRFRAWIVRKAGQ